MSIVSYPNIEISIGNITSGNRRVKFAKAIQAIAKALKVPVSIERKRAGEPYFYPVQQELADYWMGYYKPLLKQIYDMITAALGLPRVSVETMRKAGGIKYHGKVVYNPETGQPLMKYRGKTYDWIRDDIKNIADAFRIDGWDMSRSEMRRYQVAMDNAAKYVTRVNDDIKNEIKDVILNGIVEKRSKSQVSQDLFNRLGDLNKPCKPIPGWRR